MTRKLWVTGVVLLVTLVAGCESTPEPEQADEPERTEAPEDAGAPAGAPGETVTVDLDDRPFQLYIPESYDPAQPAPLVVLLHGYTSSATEQETYFQLAAESDRRGFLYALPDGTANDRDERFWNATEACCDFQRSGVDDSGYLRGLIDTVAASYPVDTSHIWIVGHSNGGFMAYRMACEHAEVVSAIVSLAGAATDDPSQCSPERPVSILQIHGTSDTTISYGGGANFGRPYPSVDTELAMWRDLNGCTDDPETLDPLDLDSGLDGAETTVTGYTAGCRDGSRVELWSIADGNHVPALTGDFAPAVADFLYRDLGR